MNGAAGRPEPSADADAMTGWAQLLHDTIERRLRPDGGADLVAPSWDGMFDEALASVMREMVAARLDRLTDEQFVAAYRSVHGDAALLAELLQVVAARSRDALRERTRLRLASDARVAGRVRLRELGADETLDIGLFDPGRPHLAAWRSRGNVEHRPLHRVLRIRLTTPRVGEVRVVSDTWTGAIWAERWRTPSVEPMTAARIGTPLPEAVGLLPELTLHAPVAIARDDGFTLTPPQILGYVRTLDGRLLLDPADRR